MVDHRLYADVSSLHVHQRFKCSLRLVKPFHAFPAVCGILVTGFGTAVLDLGVVILAILINNQIIRYGNNIALAIYGVVATISSLFQALFNGVGQAIQPIVSANRGAGSTDRIKHTWKLALTTVTGMGLAFAAVGLLFPVEMILLYMDATPEVIAAVPDIIRPYSLTFLSLGINIAATYYLQSAMHSRMSMIIGILRSIAVSGLLLVILPNYVGYSRCMACHADCRADRYSDCSVLYWKTNRSVEP